MIHDLLLILSVQDFKLMRLLVCTFHQQLKQDSSLHNLQKRALIIVNISKDGMALLTASRHALLNDMLQREHIRVFIGLKLDMETIPKCRMHENKNDGGKKRNTDQMLFFKFPSYHSYTILQQISTLLALHQQK